MRNKRLIRCYFFIIAFSASIGTLYGQYHSNIHFHFMHESEIDTSKVCSFMPFPCYVQQKIIVPAITTDTVELELPYCTMCWLNTIMYFDIQIQHSDTSISPKNYSFYGNILKFPSFSHDTLTISYWYNSESFIYHNYTPIAKRPFFLSCLFMCQETWHSTHFKHQDMIIDSIRITLPEDVGFLLEYQHAKEGNDIFINDSIELAQKNFSLFVYDTSYYYKKEISTNPVINAYLFRGTKTIDLDKYIFQPKILDNNELIKKIPSNIDSIIANISSFFDKKIDTLEIIDGVFEIQKAVWGSVFYRNNKYAFFTFDERFWKYDDWCHEITHAYNKHLPLRDDSSYLFFHESMTEFLSIYFANDNKKKVDNIYNKKRKFYSKSNDTYTSIFQIAKNAPTTRGQGTYGTVYIKPPYCLYKLSQYVGETKFFDLLKQFYAYAKTKETYSFNDFEQFMISNGIDTYTWNVFKNSLYCNNMKQIDKMFNSLNSQKQ